MTSNVAYMAVLGGMQVGFIVIYIIIIAILGLKSSYFSFIDLIFGICKVSNNGKVIILDIYGIRVNVSAHKRFRIALRLLLLVCVFIISVVFVDGCILSTEVLAPNSMCPAIPTTDCFYFESHLVFKERLFQCPSGESVSTANITVETMVCYTWVIPSQTIISFLNQLGICSSILPLLGLFFRCLYHLAYRGCWGILLTIVFGLAMIAFPIVLLTVYRMHISFIAVILMGAAIIVLLIVLFLVHALWKLNHQVIPGQSGREQDTP